MSDWATKQYWIVGSAVVMLHGLSMLLLYLAPAVSLKKPVNTQPIQVQFVKPTPKPEQKPEPKLTSTPVATPKPSAPKPKVKPTPKPKTKPKPVVKPTVKPVIKPKPKPVVKPTPVKPKPDPAVIAAKAKADEEARIQEQQRIEQARLEKALERQREEEARLQAQKDAEEVERRRQEEADRRERARAEADAKAKRDAAAKKAAGTVVDASYNNKVQPTYPKKEQQRGKSGTVTFEFTIGTNGKAKNIRVINASSKNFSRAAKKALKASSFNVTKIDGIAVEQKARTTINFQM